MRLLSFSTHREQALKHRILITLRFTKQRTVETSCPLHMKANMTLCVGIGGKTFVADIAFVGTLSSVDPQVVRKCFSLREARGTEGALIRTFSGVNTHVTLQIGGAQERGTTNSACMWPFARVAAAVTSQMATLHERVWA